jgi:uncharacterized protein YbbK (DUF523 family)
MADIVLVSLCLLGGRCRYNGSRLVIPSKLQKLLDGGEGVIPVCPEQLGGLPTPRSKNHLTWDGDRPSVIDEQGRDVTAEFIRGARETLGIARSVRAKRAIFKSRSPSCGEQGVATKLLLKEGIEVEVIDAEKGF